jgi:predicted alpha/beta superfamily hydrolase
MISVLIINSIYCQTPSIQFKTTSKYIQDAEYVIDIILPEDYDSTYKYPFVYCVDYWLGKYITPGIITYLNFAQAIDPVIVVGIGNEGDYNDWILERTRDLTPYHIPEYDISSSHSIGIRGVTGGADNFLLFIINELIPLVETEYNSDTLNRGFFGYSYGGLFGVYTIIKEPDLFQKYFLGSPSLNFNDFSLLDSLNNMTSEEISNIKTIYITAGEKESGNMLKGFADLKNCLIKKEISSLDVTSHIIIEEDHRSAALPAYYKAFKYLYKKE